MITRAIHSLAALTLVAGCSGGAAPVAKTDRPTPIPAGPEETPSPDQAAALSSFASEDELRSFLTELGGAIQARNGRHERRSRAQWGRAGAALSTAESAPSEGLIGGGGEESITNNQEQGVDEGDIVKAHGEHLVVLRRGRLFSLDLSGGAARAVSRIDVPSDDQGAHHVWYDEMLIHGDTIVVVGYSYQSGGTQLVLFDIDSNAIIRRRGHFHLRSNDYYSSRNYASRLIGQKLIFYMPYSLFRHVRATGAPRPSLPAVRVAGGDEDDWREIVVPTETYRPVQAAHSPVLHTVVTCDLSAPSLACSARGIIGPHSRTVYVAPDAVYVWTHESASPYSVLDDSGQVRTFREEDEDVDDGAASRVLPPAMVYRLPLDGGAPGALRVAGAPIDQLSFSQTRDELRVLVRAQGGGDWMWSPEMTNGDIAVVRISLASFPEGLHDVPASAYTALPRVEGWSLHNRWVGDHIFYGTGGGWRAPAQGAARHVHIHRAGASTTTLELRHGVDRIEVMGDSGVVIGSDGRDLGFTSISLDGAPRVAGYYAQPNAAQGETRSHGFFYKPSGDERGVLGLPIRGGHERGSRHLTHGSARVLFLDVDQHHFTPLGALQARSHAGSNDRCRASCVDWYGNARPIFYRGRVFGLMGYELVEGRLDGGELREIARSTFLSPQPG